MARAIALPATRVVVMEDRARIERRGKVELGGGLERLEVQGLPVTAVDRSLRVEVAGARLVGAALERRWRERPKGGLPDDASELRRGAHALQRELAERCHAVTRLEKRAELLAAARADLLRAIAEGSGHGAAEPAAWREQLEALSRTQAEADEALRVARLEEARTRARQEEARRALAVAERREHDLECGLVIAVEGEGQGVASVEASYLVPCAMWRPAYRASLDGEAVLLEAEGVVWQRTGEDWRDVELCLSTARPTLGTTPPALTEDRIRTRPRTEEEKHAIDVAIREEAIPTAGEGGASARMPGLDDGGEVRMLEAPGRSSVPGDGQPHRVPIFSFESKAQLERVCPAELTSVVSLVARFVNGSGQVLLAGPVDLVRQAGFVGRSQLAFAAPGENMKLSFGSEDGLQVIRSVDEKHEESRLTGRRTRTRRVRLHVSNARSDAARLVVEERVPVSEVKEVEVEVLAKECAPAPSAVTKEGIARIELELAPGGTATARFGWALSAAAKVAGV